MSCSESPFKRSHYAANILAAFLLASICLSIATDAIEVHNGRVAEQVRREACVATGEEQHCFTYYKISSQRDGIYRLAILLCAVPLLILVRERRFFMLQVVFLTSVLSIFALWAAGDWIRLRSNENNSLHLLVSDKNIFDFITLIFSISLAFLKVVCWRQAVNVRLSS
ncbi:MAG: hypothetical protein J5I65_01750 [Aridibacter famidurans]|nr:hypothetical protein [Aridibacter famidurans]